MCRRRRVKYTLGTFLKEKHVSLMGIVTRRFGRISLFPCYGSVFNVSLRECGSVVYSGYSFTQIATWHLLMQTVCGSHWLQMFASAGCIRVKESLRIQVLMHEKLLQLLLTTFVVSLCAFEQKPITTARLTSHLHSQGNH